MVRAHDLILPRNLRRRMRLAAVRLRCRHSSEERKHLFALGHEVQGRFFQRGRRPREELGEQLHEVVLGWEEDDVAGGGAGEEGLCGGEDGCGVFDAAVGSRDEHLRWYGGARNREHINVHLGGESFAYADWRDPSREGEETVCFGSKVSNCNLSQPSSDKLRIRTCVCFRANFPQPISKLNLTPMNLLPCLIPLRLGQIY